MEDLLKKVIYTGVGLVSVTAEKLQEAMDKLVAENKISNEEGRKVIDDLIKTTEDKKEEFESQLKKITDELFDRVKVVSKKDFEDLLKRVEALEGIEGGASKKATPKKKEVVAEEQA